MVFIVNDWTQFKAGHKGMKRRQGITHFEGIRMKQPTPKRCLVCRVLFPSDVCHLCQFHSFSCHHTHSSLNLWHLLCTQRIQCQLRYTSQEPCAHILLLISEWLDQIHSWLEKPHSHNIHPWSLQSQNGNISMHGPTMTASLCPQFFLQLIPLHTKLITNILWQQLSGSLYHWYQEGYQNQMIQVTVTRNQQHAFDATFDWGMACSA